MTNIKLIICDVCEVYAYVHKYKFPELQMTQNICSTATVNYPETINVNFFLVDSSTVKLDVCFQLLATNADKN
jgi:hypothetical protein